MGYFCVFNAAPEGFWSAAGTLGGQARFIESWTGAPSGPKQKGLTRKEHKELGKETRKVHEIKEKYMK